ncbi:MAG: pyruvate dehydrogenase (acetyl-transferring) E1 component subunit alpha [Campylobacterales bacterium]|nr:pyruvate dehydrogenase (acetyl-transferring) E1 component subunit alpha [Campylobacterales bacterium]
MQIDINQASSYYRQMLLIRRFEEKCMELYSHELIRGFLHLYIGEEAIAVGVMDAAGAEDAVIATYREHGHALARGIPAKAVMAELLGKAEGCSRGRGGSMHIFDAKRRFYGGLAIVAGGLPLAVGMALADRMMKRDRVTICFFGEGAVAEGEFHESLNLAALWRLPILFVCENNGYAMGTALERSESEQNIAKKASAYNISASQVDGMDVFAVAASAKEAIAQIKENSAPVFIECLTYRFRAHSMFDAELYRDKAEVEKWKQKDPLTLLKNQLETAASGSQLDEDALEKEVASVIGEAVAFAKNGTLEEVADLEKFVYSEEVQQ